jgi:hypothetical protein
MGDLKRHPLRQRSPSWELSGKGGNSDSMVTSDFLFNSGKMARDHNPIPQGAVTFRVRSLERKGILNLSWS